MEKLIKTLDKVIPEWRELDEPETLSIILKNKGVDLPTAEMEAINAIKTLISSDSPWTNPFIFENVVDAFNGNPVLPGILTKPPLENIIYTINIMNSIKDREFSQDIKKYIAAIATNDGFIALPPPISFSNKYIPDSHPEVRSNLLENMDNILKLIPESGSFEAIKEIAKNEEINLISVQVFKILSLLHAKKILSSS